MNTQELLDPECWAKKTFGASKLKDIRRTVRAVKAATRMAHNASVSLPAHMQTWKETMALYRLLDEEDVTFEALMHPHWDQTREQMESRPGVLRVQGSIEVDLSHHPKTRGLGQVGTERGRGLNLQTVLAILPESGEVLGCAMQEPFVRTPAPKGETRSLPTATHTHFLVRAFEKRRIEPRCGTTQSSARIRCERGLPKPAERLRCLPVMDERLARPKCIWLLAH
jgi:hypothetical protein